MLQMKIYIFVVLLLSSVTVSAGLENVLILAEFIADIYLQLPRSCIFIINCETEQGENEFCVISLNVVILMNINVLTLSWERKCLIFATSKTKALFSIILF
jgi:hypothetical protein